MSFDPIDLLRSSPLLLLSLGGLVLLLLDAFSRVRLVGREHHKRMPAETSEAYAVPIAGSRSYLMPLAALCLFVTLMLVVKLWGEAREGVFLYRRMLVLDRFGLFLGGVCTVGALLGLFAAPSYLREHRMEFGEYYALVLFSVAGMLILIMASDLVTVFLGVETMSLAVYVLTGSWRRSARSSEAAMKYFLMGAFISAVLLYGIALLYGISGTTDLYLMRDRLGSLSGQPLFLLGMFFVLSAFAFKISAVPFHMWAPDAYEGAPSPVTGFMMASVKAAGFAGLVRVCQVAFGQDDLVKSPTGWANILIVLSALTMTLGNLAALRQDNVKRLLAYSSISHAGYLLIGVVALGVVGDEARGPLLYYLLAYALTVVGSMTVVSWAGAGHKEGERVLIGDWAGLGQRCPGAALAMTFFLLSLGGIPPTAGFFGKFYLFRAALMKTELLPLVLLGIANSLVSVYYYLRIVTAMYFRDPKDTDPPVSQPGEALRAGVLIAALLVLGFGIAPGWFSETAAAAILYTGG